MKQLQKGIYIQIYRGAIHAKTHKDFIDQIEAKLVLFKSLGVAGVLMHGFTSEMDTVKFKELADLTHKHGLLCLAAYGLDSSDPAGKGQRMGRVAAMPECDALVLDMEGAWENEASDKVSAVLMGKEIKKLAPNALIIDQPWPVPTYHWSSFPWEETAAYVDIRAPQYYAMDWLSTYGKDAYEKCFPWFDASWAKLDQRLAAKGLVKPEIKTIQGYKWFLDDLCDCIMKYDTIFVWCEPWPDDTTIKAIQVVNKIKSLGFTSIADYQKSVGLTPDGKVGPLTLQKLGF